jgi:hypothetical protein
MPIDYSLFKNNLTDDPDDYLARVVSNGTADLDQVIERMVAAGTTVTRADALSALESFFTAVTNLLLEGVNVTTPIANFKVGVRGVFNGPDDSFTPDRHQVNPTVSAGKRLRQEFQQKAQLRKQESNIPSPRPEVYLDINSDTRNLTLTPGGMGHLIGHRLKFDAADLNQGIFFIAADGTEARVTIIGQIKPSSLMFVIPNTLATGEYTVEVRAVLPGTTTLRNGRLPAPLAVP